MNNDLFMDVIVQAALFLELSDAQTVNEDAAVDMLEQIAATLQKLDAVGKARLLQFIRSRAELAESHTERTIIENLPVSLGLVSE
jgi:hypothetical protein